jgi:tRNA pseudouridine38-40 synthase
MPRYALKLEYDGSAYVGWQRQDNGPSVQADLEEALGFVAAAPVRAVCAGRTDTGVHAQGQVVHFDSPAQRSPRAWVLGSNSRLPPDVAVLEAQPVPDHFHARYSAMQRHYRYCIHNARARSALLHHRMAWEHRPLDAAAMHAAGQALLGEHDFSAFRGPDCQSRTPMRRLSYIAVHREGEAVLLDISANAFLHHMVRNIAGSLIAVGRGERPADWIAEVLDSRDRRCAGVTAPPQGLYFMRVDYPAEFLLWQDWNLA